MTKSLHRHCTFKTVLERKQRSGFSAEMRRCEEKAQKWRAVADCSRHEQQRPGRLDRRELSSADNQWWRQGWATSLSSLEISWSAEFVDEVWWCQPMQAFVYEDGEFEVNPFTIIQPMELTKNRSDVVEFSWRKNMPSSCNHHRLEPLKKMCWDANQGRDKTSDDMSD